MKNLRWTAKSQLQSPTFFFDNSIIYNISLPEIGNSQVHFSNFQVLEPTFHLSPRETWEVLFSFHCKKPAYCLQHLRLNHRQKIPHCFVAANCASNLDEKNALFTGIHTNNSRLPRMAAVQPFWVVKLQCEQHLGCNIYRVPTFLA